MPARKAPNSNREPIWAPGRLCKSVGSIKRVLLTILLNARGAQAGEAVLVDRILPREKFLHRQRVAVALLFEGEKPATNRGDDFRLAADDPTLRSRRR